MPNIYNLFLIFILYLISFSNVSFLLETKPQKNILSFITGIILFTLTIFVPTPLRLIIQLTILIIIFSISSKNIKIAISAVTFNHFIIIFLDITLTCFTLIITKSIETTSNINYLITTILGILSYISIRKKIFLQFWNIIKTRLREYIYMLIILILMIFYLNIDERYNIISNNLLNFSILFIILTMLLFKLMNKTIESNSLEIKINELIEFMQTYEKQLEEQLINQHEYQNILLCLKSMTTKNKEANKFIDSILEKKISQDYSILKDIHKLQISPLKGLLYYKLCICKEKEINFALNISSNINYKKVNKLEPKVIKNLSIILGNLLDNAIDACQETETKSISIYIYEEKKYLTFQISNTFKGTINIDLIFKKGYSTKGKKHGCGLYLVKSKLNENKRLKLKTEINNDIFTQYLKVNLEK